MIQELNSEREEIEEIEARFKGTLSFKNISNTRNKLGVFL